jgi:hypothetical protein
MDIANCVLFDYDVGELNSNAIKPSQVKNGVVVYDCGSHTFLDIDPLTIRGGTWTVGSPSESLAPNRIAADSEHPGHHYSFFASLYVSDINAFIPIRGDRVVQDVDVPECIRSANMDRLVCVAGKGTIDDLQRPILGS